MGGGEIKFKIGDKVKIQKDHSFLHGHPPSQWPCTHMEGKVGLRHKSLGWKCHPPLSQSARLPSLVFKKIFEVAICGCCAKLMIGPLSLS